MSPSDKGSLQGWGEHEDKVGALERAALLMVIPPEEAQRTQQQPMIGQLVKIELRANGACLLNQLRQIDLVCEQRRVGGWNERKMAEALGVRCTAVRHLRRMHG